MEGPENLVTLLNPTSQFLSSCDRTHTHVNSTASIALLQSVATVAQISVGG